MATQNDETQVSDVAVLTDLVNYQPGAVVSRTLVKKPAGTVTLFAFDVGEALSEHTAPFDALVLALEGEAEITVAGNPQRALAGQLVRLPAHRPHAVQAASRFKMLLIMVRE